jgi:hypothetical protein
MTDRPAADEFRVVEFSVTTRPVEDAEADSTDVSVPKVKASGGEIADIGRRFCTRLQLLWTYVTKIGTVAHATSVTNAATLLALIGELSTDPHGADRAALAIADVTIRLKNDHGELKTESLSIPITAERHLKTIAEHRTFSDAAIRILHESAVQQLVNGYENLVADLVRRHILSNTRAAAKDQTITYQELLEYGSLEEAQRRVTEVMVTAFVRGKNTLEHLQYMKKELNVDVLSHFQEVDPFRELVLRRHAIVHAGGVATAEYVRRVREIAGMAGLQMEGKRLDLDASYIAENWDRTYALGVITCHLAGVSEARRNSDKDLEEAVDYFLINASYWAIENKRYHAAELTLKYASRLHLSKDTCQRMVAINLAQTLKWQGQEEAARIELDRHDWESASRLFRLGAEVIREGPDVEKHMRGAVADGDLSADAVYAWPLFRRLREMPDFDDMVKRVFGDGIAGPSNEFAAAFLDFDYEETLRKLARVGRERATAKLHAPPNRDESDSEPTVH